MGCQTCNNYETYKTLKQVIQFLMTQKALHSKTKEYAQYG